MATTLPCTQALSSTELEEQLKDGDVFHNVPHPTYFFSPTTFCTWRQTDNHTIFELHTPQRAWQPWTTELAYDSIRLFLFDGGLCVRGKERQRGGRELFFASPELYQRRMMHILRELQCIPDDLVGHPLTLRAKYNVTDAAIYESMSVYHSATEWVKTQECGSSQDQRLDATFEITKCVRSDPPGGASKECKPGFEIHAAVDGVMSIKFMTGDLNFFECAQHPRAWVVCGMDSLFLKQSIAVNKVLESYCKDVVVDLFLAGPNAACLVWCLVWLDFLTLDLIKAIVTKLPRGIRYDSGSPCLLNL
jgi:hypothetical protein